MTGRTNATIAAIPAALLLSACAYTTGVTGPEAGSNPDQELPTFWQSIATTDDRRRISNWRRAFREGVADAAAGGHANEVAAEGVLLRPDAGLADPRPPAGDYRCRFVKLGSQGSVPLSFVAYPWFRCRIDDQGETMRFRKLTGSQRPSGTFYPENRLRMVFLGVLELGDETRSHVYGRDANRDMAGTLERIGEARWRIVLPYPRFESIVDVLELVPENDPSPDRSRP
ncbi:DUF4893 domain-containing protein [Parasphingopyxis algicola]|uniref:DUF4893 domain-containing protein n=1 Tax=Parasphingopyxis algicola TaxID=2026624 RepID=UPI0015A0483A|nr:DUF4893 domain-containing protein [Parasphingopyxis algicola]QLC25864.1 DUF4893 domain-containing protein [Parasphingopyxis algicola]